MFAVTLSGSQQLLRIMRKRYVSVEIKGELRYGLVLPTFKYAMDAYK